MPPTMRSRPEPTDSVPRHHDVVEHRTVRCDPWRIQRFQSGRAKATSQSPAGSWGMPKCPPAAITTYCFWSLLAR